MPELTHDAADEGFHEIQLSGKQLVFLFMATTIVAVVIFLCGVQVGRGVKSDRTAEPADTLASATIPSAAAPSATPSGSEAPAAAASGPPAAEPPAPADEGDDELSYAKRLQSDTPPKEQLKAPAAVAAPAPPAATPEPAKAAPAATTPPAKVEPPATASALPAGARPGVWVVQLVALKDRGAAAAVVQRLTGKGYPAFVVSPAAGAPAIYRVQVGRYNDRREAEQVARRLEKEEQFKPWISH